MFEDITPETIKAAILAEIDTGLDTREGSFLNDMICPVAMELWKCYQAMNALASIAFVDEDSGGYIDLRCAEYGITRKAGTRASADLTFAGTSGTVIPAGTAFVTSGGLEFILTGAVTLANGGGGGTAEAADVGEVYNVGAGEITNMVTAIAGLSSFTSAAASGGTDAETDAALLERLNTRLQTPATSGNAYQYRQWALSVPGVGDARVLPLWAGPGTVKVLLADGDKRPVGSSVAEAAGAYIAEEAPIGAAVTVESAEALAVNVAAAVTLDTTTTLSAVREELEAGLEAYLKGLVFETYTLRYNRVAALLLAIDGVVDYTSLTVNGGTGNLTISENQAPVKGTVAVT